jgi:hypothetical protein
MEFCCNLCPATTQAVVSGLREAGRYQSADAAYSVICIADADCAVARMLQIYRISGHPMDGGVHCYRHDSHHHCCKKLHWLAEGKKIGNDTHTHTHTHKYTRESASLLRRSHPIKAHLTVLPDKGKANLSCIILEIDGVFK